LSKITLEQVVKILTLISKANISEAAVQKTLIERFDLVETMIKNPEAVKAMDRSLFEAFILSNVPSPEMLSPALPNNIEEAVSEYCYPAGWCLKTTPEQMAILSRYFPHLTLEAESPASLPQEAEGWLLVPKPSAIANTYGQALEKLLSVLAGASSTFYNMREGKLGPGYLRLTEKTRQVLDKLERSTPGDYLVLAIQCGLQHRARSVSQARQTFKEKEYGLGPFEIATSLLTHPGRLSDYEHLGIDCPGCEYATSAEGDFNYSLSFNWSEEGIYFDCSAIDGVAPGFGSASGFLIGSGTDA
jgi:hypothetical protein